jgi:hypothetical protein
VIRWNRTGDLATCYTADPMEARRWTRLGYPVKVFGRTREGNARGWQAKVPIEAVALLALAAGQVKIPAT